MKILSAAVGMLVAAFALFPAFAGAPPPALQPELAICQKLHGTGPSQPVATGYAGGFSAQPDTLTPAAVPGATTVNAKVASCLIDAMGRELIVLQPMEGDFGLPDAYALPAFGLGRAATEDEAKRLAATLGNISDDRKDRPILVYCHSSSCFIAYNAILHMRNAGYKNLLWMRDGIDGWKDAGLVLSHVRRRGARYVPPAAIPTVEWSPLGDRTFPKAPGHDDPKRWEPLQQAGVKLTSICAAARFLMKAKDQSNDDIVYELEALLYAAAGVSTDQDHEVVIRRKMQAFWLRHGDLLECYEDSVGNLGLFKFGLRGGHYELLHTAIDDWKLPPAAFNKLDVSDGRTLLDFVESYYSRVAEKTSLERLYPKLRAAGARTQLELVRDGKLESAEVMQVKAIQAWRTRAEEGNIAAMFHLSNLYRFGHHTAPNPAEALRWWDRAGSAVIAKNDGAEMAGIGKVYYFGEQDPSGIKQDPEKAVEWFRRAHAAGSAEGSFWLGRAYLDGHGARRDVAAAIPYLEQALERGETSSTIWLSTAHIRLKNSEKAAYYLRAVPPAINVEGVPSEEWFAKLGVRWCGPRAKPYQEIPCDGANDAPPGLPFQRKP